MSLPFSWLSMRIVSQTLQRGSSSGRMISSIEPGVASVTLSEVAS